MEATAAVFEAIDAARVATREAARRAIREAEVRRDAELARLDSAEGALRRDDEQGSGDAARGAAARGAKVEPEGPPTRTHTVKPGIRRKHLSPATPQELAERRDAIARLLEEVRKPLSRGEIGQMLGLTPHKVMIALDVLIKVERRVETVGTGATTRYVPASPGTTPLSRQAPTQGTIEERVLALLEDRHHASAEELAQALGEPPGRVREACGGLQGAEKVRMSRINDRPVYVLVTTRI